MANHVKVGSTVWVDKNDVRAIEAGDGVTLIRVYSQTPPLRSDWPFTFVEDALWGNQ